MWNSRRENAAGRRADVSVAFGAEGRGKRRRRYGVRGAPGDANPLGHEPELLELRVERATADAEGSGRGRPVAPAIAQGLGDPPGLGERYPLAQAQRAATRLARAAFEVFQSELAEGLCVLSGDVVIRLAENRAHRLRRDCRPRVCPGIGQGCPRRMHDPVLGPVPSGLPSSCRQDTPDERKRGRSALSRSHRQRVAVPCSKISPAGPLGAGFGP